MISLGHPPQLRLLEPPSEPDCILPTPCLVLGQGVWQEAPWDAARAVPELTQPQVASPNWNLEQGSGDATRLTGWKWVSHEMLAQPPPQASPGLSSPSAQPWEVPRAGWSPSWSLVLCLPQLPVLCSWPERAKAWGDPGRALRGPTKMPRWCQHHLVLLP